MQLIRGLVFHLLTDELAHLNSVDSLIVVFVVAVPIVAASVCTRVNLSKPKWWCCVSHTMRRCVDSVANTTGDLWSIQHATKRDAMKYIFGTMLVVCTHAYVCVHGIGEGWGGIYPSKRSLSLLNALIHP